MKIMCAKFPCKTGSRKSMKSRGRDLIGITLISVALVLFVLIRAYQVDEKSLVICYIIMFRSLDMVLKVSKKSIFLGFFMLA